jgi:hypothetical protein
VKQRELKDLQKFCLGLPDWDGEKNKRKSKDDFAISCARRSKLQDLDPYLDLFSMPDPDSQKKKKDSHPCVVC